MAQSTDKRRRAPYTARKPGRPKLKRDPQLWGLLIGSIAATGVYSYSVWNAWPHVVLFQPGVIIGVLLTFVISYALAGVCAYLLIDLVKRELAPPTRRSRISGAAQSGRQESSAPVAEAQNTPGQQP